ncbi:hypothetical protein, partial [Salinicola sp. CR57]|uniref:hypothetical protein n=1 Tax=Salinicola sp. CR57 TaxID=1949086 RepID=UPI0018E57D54
MNIATLPVGHAAGRAAQLDPNNVATRQSHLPVVQSDGRAGFGELRAELHARSADRDLVALWSRLKYAERRAVIASAGMASQDATRDIGRMSQTERNAIRAAIGRMSRYAQTLNDQLGTDRHDHPSRAL